MGVAIGWRTAMAEALYGPSGFFTRTAAGPDGGAEPGSGPTGHFRTSAHASPLFATAMLRLVAATDEALGRPDPLDVVDVGAGGGHLLRRLTVLAPAYLAKRLRLMAVELAPPPADLPADIGWSDEMPAPGSLCGLVIATEWLDNVPLNVAEVGEDGVLRYVLVEPLTGTETHGDPVIGEDAEWADRWWSDIPWEPGVRVELGGTRDRAWASAVAALDLGLAITVDYGHLRDTRPGTGTLTGFYAGRPAPAVPDGLRDITAHVAIDAAGAAGEVAAAEPATVTTQRDALVALGVDGSRPPVELAARDPAAYVGALSAATQAAELIDAAGLGGHYWIVQPVGLPLDALPVGLRPAAED
jgi:SAM-dependent MidA family methyltransferase